MTGTHNPPTDGASAPAAHAAVLVHLEFPRSEFDAEHGEFVELARSAGAEVRQVVGGRRRRPDARLYVGRGKAGEVGQAVRDRRCGLAVFNHDLSPAQERNLERELCCRVLDRTGLILDIFAQRARSHEGKLQVELAQLQHLSTRLVRGWSHLERQRGGIGLRGPGETQLEVDRRLLGRRIALLKRRLELVRRRRALGRRARIRHALPTVSLVGYTNAGKSTLFNALTGARTYASGKMFATLDPTLRRIALPDGREAILADTVGFVRDLPHDLVAAFHATLEETREAALLLHVIDVADPERHERVRQVESVLEEIGALEVPRLLVLNKVDRTDRPPSLERDAEGHARRVSVSALDGGGLGLLRDAIAERVGPASSEHELTLPPTAARLRAQLFELDAVCMETVEPSGAIRMRVRLPPERLRRLAREAGIELPAFPAPEAPC